VESVAEEEARLREQLRALRPRLGAEALAVSDDAAARAAYMAQLWAAQAAQARAQTGVQVQVAPAGWYPDPWRQARWRWWDGHQWTGYASY
jgi:hypothetical protein